MGGITFYDTAVVTHNQEDIDIDFVKITCIRKESLPKTAVYDKQYGYNDRENSWSVSKHVDPEKETKCGWNGCSHV